MFCWFGGWMLELIGCRGTNQIKDRDTGASIIAVALLTWYLDTGPDRLLITEDSLA